MICWFENNGNTVFGIETYVCFMSVETKRHSGFYTSKKNFRETIALFVGKNRCILGRHNWLINPNVYLPPNTNGRT
jgi:hypothetical protein